jgi:ADP-ribose pyrophosphatase YjhB (NUDIX family)
MENENRVGLGAFACVFNKDFSKVLLLLRNAQTRAREGADWGNVGGKVEFRETTMQACIREVREEIGVDMKPSDLRLIYVIETPNFKPHIQAIDFIYAATMDESQIIKLDSESERFEWFEISNLPDRMLASKEDILGWRDLAKSGSRISQNQ